MSKQVVKEGARLYALKKAAKSMARDLPILPVQAAAGAGFMAATSGGNGKAAALGAVGGVVGHLAFTGNDARKVYKNSKERYKTAMKAGETHDWDGERYKPLTGAEKIGKRMGTWKEEYMNEAYEDIIQGAIEGNAVQVKDAVHSILADKIAAKVEEIKLNVAAATFGGEEDGRPKVDDQPDTPEEDDLPDFDEFQDDEFDGEFDDDDLGPVEDLETDK